MTKTHKIYIGLAAFFALGVAIDWNVWDGQPPAWTWNDVMQMIGVITLCLYWESADAMERGAKHSRASQLCTILLPPLGTGLYLAQTHRATKAVVAFFAFWGGLVASAFVTDEICYRLLSAG
ncbi:hypothetical protein [Yoonia litorea]|uniref:Uncharacterized protein n=1 Tax=Yoonia litorea TaxID=1123755 RepID=A0A1I6MBI2_9RHOB|nr:hypothetical protein [Yoonia litorea]SFS13079.1 hypothetical protein SAMN05444714_1494 [Yoonia litorea]